MPSVVIAVLAETRDAIRGLRDTTTAAQTMGDKVKSSISAMSGPAIGALGGLGAMAYKAGQAASEMSDTIGASKVVFGDAAASVESFANNAAKNFGISKQAALEAGMTLGTIGKSAGLSGPALSDFSNQFTGLAGDLASFRGGTAQEAIDALGAAMRGEAEPIRKYGILLDDATLRSEALKMGLISSTKDALTPQQKALAASNAILAQSKDAMGDFARTSDSAKNRQETFKAELANVTAEMGTQLLPAMAAGAAKLSEFVRWASENQTTVKALAATLGGLAAAVLAVNVGMKVYAATQAIVKAATAAWTGVQWLLNAAMTANPLGLIVLAIAAVVAGIVIAYKKSDTFRKVVDKVMKDVVKAFGWLMDAAKKVFGWLKDNWKTILMVITGPIGLAVGLVIKYWDQISSATSKAFRAVKDAVSSALDTVKSIVSTVTAWVLARIRDYVGLYVAAWNGIVALYNKAVQVKDQIVSAIASLGERVMAYLRTAVAGAVAVWDGIVALWGRAIWVRDAIFNAIGNIIGGVRDLLSNAVNTALGVWNRITDLAGAAWRAKDSILGVFSGAWQWLVGAGEDIIRGLLSGIDRAYGWLRDKLGGVAALIPDWLKKVLGIASPSKVMAKIGQNVMRGLAGGIEAAEPLLRRQLDRAATAIAGLDAEPHVGVRVDGSAVAGRAGGGGVVNLNVNVPPTADPAEVGRQTVKALKAYASSVGRAVVVTQ